LLTSYILLFGGAAELLTDLPCLLSYNL
jgi:hypothetical protein